MEHGNPYMHYEFDDKGNYILVKTLAFGTIERTTIGPMIAIAFSYDESEDKGIKGGMHKHGSPEHVNAWAQKTRKKFSDAGNSFGLEMAEQITVMEGIFPLDELDKIISITGYIGTFYERNRDVTTQEYA